MRPWNSDSPAAAPRHRCVQGSTAEHRFGDGDRWRELIDRHYPPGRVDHIADAVAFLASDRSGNTTGTIVTIDGGASAR